MIKVLIVEDEEPIRELVRMTLEREGYACDLARDGKQAADLVEEVDYDLVLLDIMLPHIDGYELAEYILPLGMPVIFLTARGEVADRVRGLRLGADDYIVKPFEPAELCARAQAVLRRSGRAPCAVTLGDVSFDITERRVTKGSRTVELTPRETDLLLVLMQNPGRTLYREFLYDRVWDGRDLDTRTLDTHISRLRKKLGWQGRIKTVARIGYRLEADEP